MISTVIAAVREARPREGGRRVAAWLACVFVLMLVFGPVLAGLAGHALNDPLHSHIPLIPAFAAYLLYARPTRRPVSYGTSPAAGVLLCVLALVVAASGIAAADRLSANDYLATMTLAFVGLIWSSAFLILGAAWMKSAAFPLAFLTFMVPLPDAAISAIEMASVWASADAAAALFRITGTPLLRDGTRFGLPGIVLEVARECSGIRSSWVLFITSIAASYMFLATPGRRLALVLCTIPLAIVRNAVRIVTIGLLAVYVGPHTIDSAIHRQGGPLFFALSLVPLFALVRLLRRQEQRRHAGV